MKSKKLGLLTSKIGSGITPRGGSKVYVDTGTYLIRSQNIYNDHFEKDGLVCITDETADKMKAVEVQENDALINITGDSVARTFIISKEFLPARVNQHVCILRTTSELDPHYLYYFLIEKNTQNFLLSIAGSGGTRSALTKEMLENLIIKYDDIDIQQKKTASLIKIKSQIELLKKQNQILRKIVQSIFRSWFVDFDGQTKFVDSELGQIPKEFQVKKLCEIATIKGRIGWLGYTLDDLREHGPLVIGGKHINTSNRLDLSKSVYISEEKYYESPEIQISKYDIIITKTGNIGPLVIIDRNLGLATINPNVVLIKAIKIFPYFLYLFFLAEYAQNYLKSGASSGSVQPTINNKTLNAMNVLIPSKGSLEKFEEKTSGIFELLAHNELKIENLTELHNSLIQKLITS